MINGVRVRDSGVELSPTGTDRRGGPRTASNRTVRASSAIAAGSTRWLMRRTKRPGEAAGRGAGEAMGGRVARGASLRYIKKIFISEWPIQPHGSSFFGNRGRIDAVAHAAPETATFGHSRGLGQPWPSRASRRPPPF